MKKKMICLFLGMAMLLLTACQSENEPVRIANALADLAFHQVDSDLAMETTGISAEELNDIFISWTEAVLTSGLLPEDPEEEELYSEEDGTESEDTETTDEEITEEILQDEEIVDEEVPQDEETNLEEEEATHPLIEEMAREFLQAARDMTSYSSRIMTLSRDTAVVRIAVTGMDIQEFYSQYFSFLMSAGMREEGISDDEFLESIFDDYMEMVNNLAVSSEPVDVFIELVRFDDGWGFASIDTALTQLYSILVGNPYFQ